MAGVVKPIRRMGDRERAVVEQRSSTGYRAGELNHFGGEVERTLRALLERLLPGVAGNIDLVAFIDQHAGTPLGRGDRRAGLPPEQDLLTSGLAVLTAAGFAEWSGDDQLAAISRIRRGDADDEFGVPAKDFVDRLLDKALAGYLAHPDTWIRIGFTGPAFPEGHAWIGPAEAIARRSKKIGWDKL